MNDTLKQAVKAILAEAQDAFDTDTNVPTIQRSSRALRGLLTEWQMQDKVVVRTIRGLLDLVQDGCTHPGARTGSNERDGFWMAECPICGESK